MTRVTDMTSRIHVGLISRFARFARDARAVSAVEFALILPIMVTLFLGGTELSQAISVKRKAVQVNRTVADLAAQDSQITSTEMGAIFGASTAVVAPFSSTNLKIVVSQLFIDQNGTAKVKWSDAYQTARRAIDSTVTLPAGLNTPNTYLVFAETTYTYTPPIGYTITGPISLTDQMYLRPRLTASIARDPCPPCGQNF
jgi:Flp pilus assembly protein TadG